MVASTGGTGTTTFQTTADAQVKSTSATGNYGSAATLRLRLASDIYRSYVKFTVQGVGGDVTAAKLRLHVADAGPDGGRVHLVANTWTESGVTWNNAPAIGGTALSSVGAVTLGTWAEFDVSSAVDGNGTYSFGLLNSNGDSVLYTEQGGAGTTRTGPYDRRPGHTCPSRGLRWCPDERNGAAHGPVHRRLA